MTGIINVLKPTGWTSADVTNKVKHIVWQHVGHKVKVGHLGTLDAPASGVLPVCIGSATRLFDYFVHMDKVYRTTFVFGKTTDTLDSQGTVVATSEKIPDISEIEGEIRGFVGEIMQVPPKYSRVSVDGVRAGDAARAGKEIELAARRVNVYSIRILDYHSGVLRLDIHCSGGTYVRSICRDLAAKLSSAAYVSSIIRLKNKTFDIAGSVTMDELEADFEGSIIPLMEVLCDLPKVEVQPDEIKRLLNGVRLPRRGITGDYLLMINDEIFGICNDTEGGVNIRVRLWNY